jgi:uncharacterized caspase-like protein
MKKQLVIVLVLLVIASAIQAQQKFALVIGNGDYSGISALKNPVNDARDMEAALKGLGFAVDLVLNGGLDQMETAAVRLKNRLSASRNSYGFLFYAGHGVQSNGENYLLPVDARIQSENQLRQRAVALQWMLDEINQAGNELNVVVLDACRDNPFGWSRSGSRGLSLVAHQPADSIIVYATSAGSTAADGTGRNGLFTGELLKNLKTPGIDVSEVFKRTGADVSRVSGNQQRPAVYNQFFGTAYLSAPPATAQTPPPAVPQAPPAPPQAVSPQPASVPPPNNPNVSAKQRQSEIILNAEHSDKNMAVWVNGTLTTHLAPNAKEKIIVPEGQNLVEVAEATKMNGQWTTGSRKQIRVVAYSQRITIGITTRYGRLLDLEEQDIATIMR